MATHLTADIPVIGEPVVRWSDRAHGIAEVESALARMWASQDLSVAKVVDEAGGRSGQTARHIAARTSVMNLVVIARNQELAARSAATIQAVTGRHPSRTMVIQPADPDGPSWIDARIEAYCVLPREDAPETCAEMIDLTAGGEAGRHLAAIVTPLVIHDLPVSVWWPGEPPFGTRPARDLFATADRLIVDGSTWGGDGLGRLREFASLLDTTRLRVVDFGFVRQSRWREAIASVFDDPDFLTFLHHIRRIAVTYATHDETGAPDSTNLVKPVYHVGWLASRLRMSVVQPLAPVEGRRAAVHASTRTRHATGVTPVVGRGLTATLREAHGDVAVVLRPVLSEHVPAGTTLRVEILAERRGQELRADVTAEAETVHVRVWWDGVEALDRHFLGPRRTDVDLLAEAIETGHNDRVAVGALRAAASLAGAGARADGQVA